ncbi:MAG TPA: haloacid dehalogenase type II [Thermomicrobiales bacterium]|nr:haloacid dehalogenase type II [Thermomicrobiales bacterium]
MANEIELSQIDWITFDCYGTLVDWEGAFGALCYSIGLRNTPEPPPGPQLRKHWEEIQFELTQGPYQDYKKILAESIRTWVLAMGYQWHDSYGPAMTTAMRAIQAFHDTKPALERARAAGLKLAIISNTDRDIITHSIKQIEVPFDKVIVAQDVGAYKPSPKVFEYALKEIGGDPARMLHTAFGFKYDIGPAQQFGMKTAWVNRNAEQLPDDRVQPDFIWRDLWGLAAFAGKPYDV